MSKKNQNYDEFVDKFKPKLTADTIYITIRALF